MRGLMANGWIGSVCRFSCYLNGLRWEGGVPQTATPVKSDPANQIQQNIPPNRFKRVFKHHFNPSNSDKRKNRITATAISQIMQLVN